MGSIVGRGVIPYNGKKSNIVTVIVLGLVLVGIESSTFCFWDQEVVVWLAPCLHCLSATLSFACIARFAYAADFRRRGEDSVIMAALFQFVYGTRRCRVVTHNFDFRGEAFVTATGQLRTVVRYAFACCLPLCSSYEQSSFVCFFYALL